MSKSKNIEVGKNVIKIEAQAVAAIADRIGDEFESSVNSILNCKGRLIIPVSYTHLTLPTKA